MTNKSEIGAAAPMANLSTDVLADIAEYRSRLIRNGYAPVPIHGADCDKLDSPNGKTSAGKAPAGIGWQVAATKRRTGWAEAGTTNTGVLCDGLRAVDVDVDDEQLVQRIREAACRHLGTPIAERYRAGSPRVLWPYAAALGEPTKLKVANAETGHAVEVLGKGQQFVCGILHCRLVANAANGGYDRVLSDIEWRPRGLDQIARADLPAVTPEQMAEFLAEVRLILDVPAEPAAVWATPESRTVEFGGVAYVGDDEQHEPFSDQELERLVHHLPNENCTYDEWSCFISAIHTVTNGDWLGRQLADTYSKKSSKHQDREFDKKWQAVGRCPTVHGMGFLINQAKANGWMSRAAIATNEKEQRREALRTKIRSARGKTHNKNRLRRPIKTDVDF